MTAREEGGGGEVFEGRVRRGDSKRGEGSWNVRSETMEVIQHWESQCTFTA
jgi:hypothetical protein